MLCTEDHQIQLTNSQTNNSMNGGQVTLNAITDAQLEAIIDVKKNNEGQFQLLNLQSLNQPLPPPGQPFYGPGSPWGMGPNQGQWYGPGSPFGPMPPNFHPPEPPPGPLGNSSYNVTLAWNQDQGLKAIAAVFEKLTAAV